MEQGGKYDVSGLIEAQFEPGSGNRVLKNLLGIKSKREMDEVEAAALKKTTDKFLHTFDAGHRLTALDLKQMHKTWLVDIYEWAGEYRQVNISKGGFSFAAARVIPGLMDEFEKGQLRKYTPCIFDSREKIIEALAEVHVEFLLIHPFREGNGRLARMLATIMAIQADLPFLNFTFLKGKMKEEYFAAVRAGLDRNYRPMQDIFELIVKKTLRASGRAHPS